MWLILSLAIAWAQTPAEDLATLRAEVASLSAALEAEEAELRGDLRSLSAQQGELELQGRREEVRISRIEDRIAREREALTADDVGGARLAGVVRDGLARIREEIDAGLPYRTKERLDAVDGLTRQLDAGEVDPRQAAARAWQLAEDELRLQRENAVDKQVIVLDGDERLVEVARLGMVALYFRAEDRAGYAVRTAGGWGWRDVPDRASIDELFEAMRHRVRTGWFELPNALPEVGT